MKQTILFAALAGCFGVDGLRVSRERYQSTATARSKVTPDTVVLFYGLNGAVPDDPTHTKRFWSAVEGGGKDRHYEQQVDSKLVDLTVDRYSNVLLTSSVGLRKLSIS